MSASKIIQYIHRPTLTELGMGNTHDRYLVVDADKDLSNVFPLGVGVNLTDTVSKKVYQVYSKVETGVFRLKRLGDIVDGYHMEPGDEIVITHYELSGNVLDMLTVNECGRVLLNPGKRKDGKIEDFEIVNIERLPGYSENKEYSYTCEYNGSQKDIQISFIGTRKKRSDSPIETKFYSVQFDKEKLDYDPKKYYYLTIRDGIIVLRNLPKSEYRVLLESSDANGTVSKPNKNDLQVIYYGAPGTGKSHIVNVLTADAEKEERVFRTTFHPDSDYSSFVGCYKPTKEATSPLSLHKLHELYPEFKTKVENRPLHRFITKYYNSFRLLTEKEAESVFDKIETSSTVTAEVPKIMAAIEEIPTISSISYSFVPQTFTKAYLRAWQTEDPIFLVIEEINRGNCAQIFGDLFQLLDRKNSVSEYPIKADNDLATFIGEQLSTSTRVDIPKSVKSGEELMLPSNLYIWATMNTSDQSLFPIDSAFKRRWEWRHIKIAEGRDEETRELLNWTVKFDYIEEDKPYTFECSWWEFIKAINEKIAEATSSDDKKLGYFFCKPKEKNSTTIDEERFVGKVVFYLWNDVFKDEENPIFKVTEGKGEPSFDAFYKEDEEGETIVDTLALRTFMHKVFGENKDLYTEIAKSEE